MAIVAFIVCLILWIGGYIIKDKRKKYEFLNRQAGGNVRFKKYGDTKKHYFLKTLGSMLMGVGSIGTFVTGFLVYMIYIRPQ